MTTVCRRPAGVQGGAWVGRMALLMVAMVGIGILASPAAAQTRGTDVVAAEALFEEGRDLMQQKRYGEACAKFEASHKLDPSVGALLNLGDCREKNGQTATAWGIYRQAASMARQLGDRKREQFALKRASTVEAKLSYLVIEVPDEVRVPGLSVTRNGEPVADALWGQRAPVDPGSYVIRAEAPGHEAQEISVDVVVGSGDARAVVPPLVAGTPGGEPGGEGDKPGSSADGKQPGSGLDLTVTERGETGSGMPMRRKIALASGAVGVVGLAVGSVLGLQARSTWQDIDAGCREDESRCSEEQSRQSEDAVSKGNQATVVFSVGLVAAAAGVVLWLTTPSGAEPGSDSEPRARIEPLAGPDVVGARVHLRF